MSAVVALGGLGLDEGGLTLVRRALAGAALGEPVRVVGTHPLLGLHLPVIARAGGFSCALASDGATLTRVAPAMPAEDAGGLQQVVERPPARWGLAARGAQVERDSPGLEVALDHKLEVWTDDAARIYAAAAAAQWDPETAIPWASLPALPDPIEDAVVQVMTYLIENETAALLVPARFLAQVHPHFREILQVLATIVADEARHIEVFTRRASARRARLGTSRAGGQQSLLTLVTEPDFALASFLLSVLGEGSFLSLLRFLAEQGPDPVTRQICRLAAQDEARHVAFGLAHLARHASLDPTLHARLVAAVERRHAALQDTAGLNDDVYDALVILAAGSLAPEAIGAGHAAVLRLQAEMDHGRRVRLGLLGFAPDQAEALSALHTRNFM